MAPILSPSAENFPSEYFERQASVRAEEVIPVTIFKSKRTGLTIVQADIPGPVVHGFCYLATEAQDDDGLPHTLEHVIFLGSELYPFKGVLDLVANRCLASGTNAWTEVDHTCYTVSTAGSEGFLQLLPIYLDHILYPVLTDAGFITEVHHVNGEGEDAGVVYCEMQSKENVDDHVVELAVQRAVYPEPSGFRYETGGVMKNLRDSTTNTKVRNYHATFYRPENLGVLVAGQVPTDELLLTIKEFEDRILAKPPRPEFVRPWQTPVPPLSGNEEKTVFFPCDDETNGLVTVAWRGPNCRKVELTITLSCLCEYLCRSAISPLHKEFVEQDDPYCSQVSTLVHLNLETCFSISFADVPKAKTGLIKDKLFALLEAIAKEKKPFDLKRMKALLQRKRLSILSLTESDGEDLIVSPLIADFLYGIGTGSLERSLNHISTIRDLMAESTDFWLAHLTKYFIGQKYILVQGIPSRKQMESMSEEEETRIAEQRKNFGEEGLKLKAAELQKANETNEIPPPAEMINGIPVPDVMKINFLSLTQSSNHFQNENANDISSLDSMPVCFLLDDVKSNFIRMTAMLNTSSLPGELRLYLPLFCEVILESPILRDNKLISHEKVIAQMLEDFVASSAGIGLPGSQDTFMAGQFSQVINIELTLELNLYYEAVRWMHELLFCTQFVAERLKIITNKMLNSIPRLKRYGLCVTSSVLTDLSYDSQSNSFACNLMRQNNFLTTVLQKLETEPEEIVNNMNKMRSIITHPDSITIHMAADVEYISKTSKLNEPWINFLPANNTDHRPNHKNCFASVPSPYELRVPKEKCRLQKTIVGVGAVESSFLIQTVPCITNADHPDLPAILVLLQYLGQLEGPMWRQIRGLGLAYGYSLVVKPEEGTLQLRLSECSHVLSAYKEAKKILENYLKGEEPWNTSLLESARSSLAYEIIYRERNIPGICGESLLSYFRKVDSTYNRRIIEKVWQVTIDDLNRVGSKYVVNLLDSEDSRLVVCCHPSKVDEIIHGFKELNQNLDAITLEADFLCSLDKE